MFLSMGCREITAPSWSLRSLQENISSGPGSTSLLPLFSHFGADSVLCHAFFVLVLLSSICFALSKVCFLRGTSTVVDGFSCVLQRVCLWNWRRTAPGLFSQKPPTLPPTLLAATYIQYVHVFRKIGNLVAKIQMFLLWHAWDHVFAFPSKCML